MNFIKTAKGNRIHRIDQTQSYYFGKTYCGLTYLKEDREATEKEFWKNFCIKCWKNMKKKYGGSPEVKEIEF